ncbi:uncharacterized protein DNG_01730 [Cephalotrichum gorgonifer]|uniref:Lipid droplet-associated hydrolase n=1 Tax=Cephalotrichum gorgonifer TaxID=2041049 RepID=A0AAE8MSC1_9PEZI|nr:uncharacterized protein DNG_01730 [Cephalotrichum gorgonifer]
MATKHFVFLPATRPSPKTGAHALVYFIPGNPGFVDWYEPFLKSLRAQLDDIQQGVAFDIYGRSLPGFHDDEHAPFTSASPPYNLEDHITISYESLSQRRIPAPDGSAGQPYDFVVVIGHSVGAYIALEIFQRHKLDPSPAPHLKLHHGILLCPTITHIARSQCGRFFTFICQFSFLNDHLHRLLRFLLFFVPYFVLYAWCRFLMRFSPRAAATAAGFLKSRDAIWQTLYMGRDEMTAIADDEWEEDLWEVLKGDEEHRQRVPKFMFLFAKVDHWVSCELRDEFIKRMRGRKKGSTEIVIDGGNFPHAFCTKEVCSMFVSEQVRDWLGKIQNRRVELE